MVFGFGEGKIEFSLPKTAFAYKEMIQGSLTLTLKKPKNARKLRVVIQAVQKSNQYSARGSSVSSKSQKTVMFSNEIVVDGEKEYPVGTKEYQFQIQVPDQSVLPQKPGGKLGDAMGALQMLAGTRVVWELKASLDVSGRDVSKTQQISVG